MTGYQIDRSKDGNQGNGGRYTGSGGNGNNLPRPEIELIGGYIDHTTSKPYPNLLTPGGNPDGSWDIPDVLNFNNTSVAGGATANTGFFIGDTQVPGLPGTGTPGTSSARA